MSVSCSSFSEDSRRKLSLTWLQGQLLPKIARWSEEPNLKTSLTSLKLVPLEEYNALYNKLKIKYGQHFAKVFNFTKHFCQTRKSVRHSHLSDIG